jgi:hypothetical protein
MANPRVTEAHPVAPSPSPHSPGAERMRRHRERRRQGKVCVFIELDPMTISGLVELGWLSGRRRDDRTAVIDGFCRFISFALDVTRNARR